MQELTGEHLLLRTANTEDGAWLDIKARVFWENRWQCAFFDIRVFYPNAQSNRSTSAYTKHEAEKKRTYGQRVHEVEHGSFTPLVFASTGGMGKEAIICYKRIASLLALKRNTTYSHMMAWIRCRLSFALLRSSLMCIRGTHSHLHRAIKSGEVLFDVRVACPEQ